MQYSVSHDLSQVVTTYVAGGSSSSLMKGPWRMREHRKQACGCTFMFASHRMCVCSAYVWREWLLAFGWVGSEAGLATLCKIFMRNDLRKWYQLEHVDDPTTWVDAHELGPQELAFIRMIITRGKVVPK